MTRGHEGRRLPNWLVGLIAIAVVGIASYVAFSSLLGVRLPFSDPYEVKAVFSSAQNVRPSSPVRIAGVDVGEITAVEHLDGSEVEGLEAQVGNAPQVVGGDSAPGEQAAVVTMELSEQALPLREDAEMKLRPRLFLEGNYFVDLQPGSPNAEEVSEGHTFPVNQTAYSVQIDQILTTLQSDVRADLQTLLDQLGNAFIEHGGAEGFRELYRTSPPAYKFTSQVNEAFLGTEPGDLGRLIRGLGRVVRGLGRNEAALKGFVSNLATFSGSFAAEDEALGEAIEELPEVLEAADPAFAALNSSFPALRAFAREALPGVRSTPETLRAATPFIEQVRRLVSRRELRGLVRDLRPTIPQLAKLAKRNIRFLAEARAISSCFNEVVIPWGNDTVEPPANYPFGTFGRVFETTGYGLAGIAGESRSGDANGQYIRVQAGGGTNTVVIPPGPGRPEQFVGVTPFPITGSVPSFSPIEDSAKTPFRPDEDCERQQPPDLGATMGIAPTQSETAAGRMPAGLESAYERYGELLGKLGEAQSADGGRRAERRITRRLEGLGDRVREELGLDGGNG